METMSRETMKKIQSYKVTHSINFQNKFNINKNMGYKE